MSVIVHSIQWSYHFFLNISSLIQICFLLRQNEREQGHFGHFEREDGERRGRPQQRKVRSLFLQPTWQHTVVSMLLISRLVSWEPGLLLLRLSKLPCSPVGKSGTTKHNELKKHFENFQHWNPITTFANTFPLQMSVWVYFRVIFHSWFQQGNRWTKSCVIESMSPLNKETLNDCID